jgi:predicted phage terminase large subunit-like protein
MQRLHERDLAGWLLNGGSGERWEHVCLPALAEVDDEHRKAGEALWPAKHSREKLEAMRTAMPYTFAGQYQQSPSAPEGNIFKPDSIEIVDAVPAGAVTWLTGWDFAATAPKIGKDPDWTVGLKLGMQPNGRWIIGDVARMQGTPDKVEACLVNTTKRHGRGCAVDLPQDPGQAGKAQVQSFTKLLAGYRVSSSPESGDKIQRAEPFAAQVNVGNVSMVRAPWNDDVINEMRVFPNGAHDDIVDAGSRAFNALSARGHGLIIPDALVKAVSR